MGYQRDCTLLMMVLDLTSGGNLAGMITLIVLAPLTILWLLVVLALFGISRATQKDAQKSDSSDSPS